MKRSLLAIVGLGLSGALFLGVACGGDDDQGAAPVVTVAPPGGAKADIETAARETAQAYNSGDVDAFLATVSDGFVSNVFGAFGVSTKDDLRQAAASGDFSIGDPPFEDFQVSNVTLSGDSATADDSHQEGRALINELLSFVRVGESWLLDDIDPTRVEAPEGATEANVGLVEFAFNLNRLSFPAGDVTFQASDDGKQMHEMGIIRLPEGVSLEEALQAEDLGALGIEDIAHFGPVAPGAQATWTVKDLEPGRYAYACFIPDQDDPQGTPHALKGMVGQFTVQ